MSKFLKNVKTPDQIIFIKDLGVPIASFVTDGAYEVVEQEYLIWVASKDVVTEIIAGDIIVNDGIRDLSNVGGANSEAVAFIKYPDFAPNQRFLSEPERSNDMTAKTTQMAIEAARPDIEDGGSSVQVDANILDFGNGLKAASHPVTPRKVVIEVDAFDISKGCFLPSFFIKRSQPGIMFTRSGGFVLKRCK